MKTKITSNILEDLSKRLKVSNSSVNSDKALVVFNGSDTISDKKIAELRELKKSGIQISIAFSFMAEGLLDTKKIIDSLNPVNIYGEKDIFNLKDIIREYSLLIGPNITMNTLSKVSLGMVDSFIPNIIWSYLYKGKKVYLDFTSLRNYLGDRTENKEILKQITNHIERVKNMGVVEIDEGNPIHGISIKPKSEPKKINEIENSKAYEDNDKKRRVIIEKDILDLNPNQVISIPKGSIITHLARDKAREKNIKIEVV